MNGPLDSKPQTALINNAGWSQPTRLLHLGLAATVTAQLGISLIMEPPDEEQASALSSAAFEAHEILGMTALLIVICHWMWTLFKQTDGGLADLFPWCGHAREQVSKDIRALFSGQLPQEGQRGGLPGLIHGLGFLAVTGMAFTGGLLFILLPESGQFSSSTEFVAEIHELISPLVWIYWVAHAGIALLHHYSGHSTLRDMFRFGPSKND